MIILEPNRPWVKTALSLLSDGAPPDFYSRDFIFFLNGGEHIREKASKKNYKELRGRKDLPPP
jgi:hypothetical protein